MKKCFLAILLIFSVFANANVTMPLLFSDGMVLQRDKKIPIWGFADANENVEIHFNKQIKKTTADKNGKWTVNLNAEKAGGPFELIIIGKNKITIKNVLVGEVWICSGQSNMEFQVFKTMNAEKEIADANYPMIRHFGVAQDLSGTPKDDLKQGKLGIVNAIDTLLKLHKVRPNSLLARTFFDTKTDEIVDIFNGGPGIDTVKVRENLATISPLNSSKWNKIR